MLRLLRRLAPVLTAIALAGCGGDSTAPANGQLTVAISGLPGGIAADVRVSGPDGYTTSVSASTILTSLRPGTYTLQSSSVSSEGIRFDAAPPTTIVTLDRDGLGSASIGYTPVTGRLVVEVLGLPAAVAASVQVTGPAGFARALAGSTTLESLAPGPYLFTVADVPAGGATYRALPSRREVTLVAGASQQVAISYGTGAGTLEVTISGLPPGTDAAVAVTGPNGYERTLVASTALRDLGSGSYRVEATTVGSNLTTHAPAAPARTIELADGATNAVAVEYLSAPLRLSARPIVEAGLTEPVFLTAPDGDRRLFVVERPGRIRVVENGTLLGAPFLDIANRVNFVGERGLLGMAFDPAYATNGLLYVYYVNIAGDMVVERYGSTPGSNVADGNSGSVIITIPHKGNEHHGGTIAFGPDGMLYVGPGDGGCCGDPRNAGQDRSVLLGKILRLDVRTLPYAIPAGNPFVGLGSARGEIWAYGLRNPWRFSFDVPGGMLYIGDVGDNTREEIDAVPVTAAGVNFGWRIMEGSACFNPSLGCTASTPLTPPVLDYLHTQGCSVTGGYVYRGRAIPELTGHYLYSDYCRGWLRSFRLIGGAADEQQTWSGITLTRPLSFGRDGAGELYIIGSGRVYRIERQ